VRLTKLVCKELDLLTSASRFSYRHHHHKRRKKVSEDQKETAEKAEQMRMNTVETVWQQVWKSMPKDKLKGLWIHNWCFREPKFDLPNCRTLFIACIYLSSSSSSQSQRSLPKSLSLRCPKLESIDFTSSVCNHLDMEVVRLKLGAFEFFIIIRPLASTRETCQIQFGKTGTLYLRITTHVLASHGFTAAQT